MEMFNTAYPPSDTYCLLSLWAFCCKCYCVCNAVPVVLYSEMLEAQMGELADMGKLRMVTDVSASHGSSKVNVLVSD